MGVWCDSVCPEGDGCVCGVTLFLEGDGCVWCDTVCVQRRFDGCVV